MIQRFLLLLLGLFFCSSNLFSQKYTLSTEPNQEIIDKLKDINPYDFMEFGYYVNANNIAYQCSKNLKYLYNNYMVLKGVMDYSKNNNDKFKAKYSRLHKRYKENGLEYPTYEAYFFQYAAEFLFTVRKEKLDNTFKEVNISFIEEHFDKWLSLNEDYSILLRSRIHMGAQWATTSLYLWLITGNNKYADFVNVFNGRLRENLKIASDKTYVWNSNYVNTSNNVIARRANQALGNVKQDVSHSNHVVNFIIASYENNFGKWTNKDIILLINTAKKRVNNLSHNEFYDNIDGSSSNEPGMQGRGWKQTDGWMKLVKYDKLLLSYYHTMYKKNYLHFKNSILNMQAEAIFSCYK